MEKKVVKSENHLSRVGKVLKEVHLQDIYWVKDAYWRKHGLKALLLLRSAEIFDFVLVQIW